MKRTKIILSAVMILGALLYITSVAVPAHAASSTVCLVTASSTSCPSNPPTLIGAMGTQLRIAVFLQGSNQFNAFDITILADHTILKPAGIDFTGSILPSPQTILAECLSGVLVAGSQCAPTDTIDTLHLAASGPPGTFASATTGLLFTAIYSITGTTSGIPVGFQTGCFPPTSVPPNTCVNLANGTATPVPATIQTAVFSTSTTPDFLITASPTSLTISAGTSGMSTLTITSVNNFSGTVNLAATINPSGPGLSLNPNSLTLGSGQSLTSILTISTSSSTPPGTYSATVTGTNGPLTHSTTITVTVNPPPPPPDFTISANPTSITFQRGSQGTSTVTLTSLNGFTGTIQLSSNISPTGHHTPTVSLSTSSVSLSSGGTSSDVLTVSSDKNTTVGTYTVTVTATSGSITKSTTITVTITR